MAKLQEKRESGSRSKTEAILAGAMQEFLANGYSGASMDRITAAAGVSKSTLYAHFKDKESLFTALIEGIAQQKLRLIFNLQELDVHSQDPQAALRHLAEMMLLKVTQEPQVLQVMRLLMFESGRFPHLGRTFVNAWKPGFTALSQYLASCPNLRLTDPEAAARIFMGTLVHFVIIQEGMYGKEIIPMDADRIITALIESILTSDSTPGPPSS